MFKLFYRPKYDYVTIYDIRDDKHGFPHFLIYDNNQWKYASAKHFSDKADWEEDSYEANI